MTSLHELKIVLEGKDKIPKEQLIGKRVILCEHEYENEDRPFFYGDEFIIKSIDGRTYHLVDDNGNELSVLDKHIELKEWIVNE